MFSRFVHVIKLFTINLMNKERDLNNKKSMKEVGAVVASFQTHPSDTTKMEL